MPFTQQPTRQSPKRQANNFDLLRLCLALTVFLYHIFKLTLRPEFTAFGRYLSGALAVDCFFVISGYLVFMSYENSQSLKDYLHKRARRIIPGYVAVVLTCAIGLVLLSTYPAAEYFNQAWLKYATVNLLTLNFLQPVLPGVFADNPAPMVNGALWSIKIEVMFYLCLPLIVFLMNRWRRLPVIILIYAGAILYSLLLLEMARRTQSYTYIQLERQLPGQMAFFISGAAIYYYFDCFKRYAHQLLFAALILLSLDLVYGLYPLFPAALAILVLYPALQFRYMGNFGRFGDLSYGIYIWHYPTIQVFNHFGLFDRMPWFGMVGVIICVFALSLISWHVIEKPFLRKQSHYRRASVKEPLNKS